MCCFQNKGMPFKIYSIIGFCLIVFASFAFADDKKDACDLFFDRLETIKGADILASDLNIKKTGPTAFNVNGFVELFKNLDDEWTVTMKVLKSSSSEGEYSPILSYPPNGNKKMCEFMKAEYKKYLYEDLKDHSNAPHYDTCPIPPEKYTLTDYTFDAEAFKKFLPEGYFILKVFLSHLQEKDLVEYNIYYHVEKK